MVFIWVKKLFAIPTQFSLGLPFLVRHDFVAFFTLVKFLTHRLAFSVGSTVVGIAPSPIESNILWHVPHCRQAALCVIPSQPYVKQHFHYILQRCFWFSLSLSCIPSDDVIMVFTVIKINLLFSPWSFVDNDVGLLVNHCLEFATSGIPQRPFVDTILLMQLLSK